MQAQDSTKNKDLMLVDKVPVARGCDANLDNQQLKTCFIKSVSTEVQDKINFKFIKKQDLEPGIHTVLVKFTVNTSGKIANVVVSYDNEEVSDHVLKAMNSLTKMQPAILDDKPVAVTYALPIKFSI